MRNYTQPIIVKNNELAEGVYAASGECYSVNFQIHQKPEIGRGDYRIQVNGMHAATDGHHSGEQVLTINFNIPVIYKGSNGTLIGGDGTNTISIKYNYHNNQNDNIGLGDVIVESDAGLAVVGGNLSCNHDCGQH
jgi:uncharacterized Zn-binding protein involved in type VI secretion